MARYIVVEIDSDEVADKFVQQINRGTDAGKGLRLAGIFYAPTRWCECPTPVGYHKHQLARGAKYGLWTCRVCRRARRGAHAPHNLLKMAELPMPAGRKYTCRVDSLNIFEVPIANVKVV